MENKVIFSDIEKLMKIITNLSTRNMTKLRMEKIIYFIYAYYGAFVIERDDYPDDLIDIKFTIDKYGFHVEGIGELLDLNYSLIEDKEFKTESELITYLENSLSELELEVLPLIIDIVNQSDVMGDFTLVELNHEDSVWFDCYNEKKEFSKKELYVEYSEKLKNSD